MAHFLNVIVEQHIIAPGRSRTKFDFNSKRGYFDPQPGEFGVLVVREGHLISFTVPSRCCYLRPADGVDFVDYNVRQDWRLWPRLLRE